MTKPSVSDAFARLQALNAALIGFEQDYLQYTTPQGMSLNEYQDTMSRTYRPDRKANHALGVAGEVAECDAHLDKDMIQLGASHDALRTAGRICDAVKKDVYHDRPADKTAMLKELGDVLWYVAALATDYEFTLEEVAKANVEKLKARYPEGFVKGGGNR